MKKYTDKQVIAMKKIIEKIKKSRDEKRKFNRLEYYLNGGISFEEAPSMVNYLKKNNEIDNSDYILLHNYINSQRYINVLKDKTAILSINFIFNEKIITDLEKEVIWNELINAGIMEKDIDDVVFSAAVRAYAFRNGYIKDANKTNSITKSLKK